MVAFHFLFGDQHATKQHSVAARDVLLSLGDPSVTKQQVVAARDVALSLGSQSVTKQYKVAASTDLVIVVAVQLVHPPRHIDTCMLCDMR